MAEERKQEGSMNMEEMMEKYRKLGTPGEPIECWRVWQEAGIPGSNPGRNQTSPPQSHREFVSKRWSLTGAFCNRSLPVT